MVREEWLITNVIDTKKVYKESEGARYFLYGEEGYIGREKKRKITEDAAKATKRSSKAAMASAVAAGFLLFITIVDLFRVDKVTPLLIDVQEQSRESKEEFLELKNKVQLLKSKIQELEAIRDNTDTVFSRTKTHK